MNKEKTDIKNKRVSEPSADEMSECQPLQANTVIESTKKLES